MIGAIAVVLVLQLAGEVLVRALGLPVPGPVLGMVLLFVLLAVRGTVPEEISSFANGLLSHLALLFVPAGVGIAAHLGRLEGIWPILLAVLVVSTLLTVVATALALSVTRRILGAAREHS